MRERSVFLGVSRSPTARGGVLGLPKFGVPSIYQRCGLRPSVLGQDRSQTTKSVLVLVLVLYTLVFVLVLQVWCFVVKHGLVTLIVIMILKDTATFQVLVFFLFCAWNITTVEVNSGLHLLKS